MRFTYAALLKDPLIHFLFLGSALFFIEQTFSSANKNEKMVIEITESDIARLTKNWKVQRLRLPEENEIWELVEAEIREKVLYREAQRLGLQDNDIIVRRRLAQKLEFLIEAEQTEASIPEYVLETYFKKHAERYILPAELTFSHIYFSPDSRTSPFKDASKVLKLLNKQTSPPIRAPKKGDNFPLEYDYSALKTNDITRDFGHNFAENLVSTPLNQWSGPLQSGLGFHLVYVTKQTPASMPTLKAVHTRLISDYKYDKRESVLQDAYLEMRQNYTIELPQMLSNPK